MDDVPGDQDRARWAVRGRVDAKAGRGLWPLVCFAGLSLWARTDFRYLPSPPAEWRSILGRPPPPAWIDAAFVLYLFSALVLSLARMAGEGCPGTGFRHLGYLAAFYGFYHVSEALPDNYLAVLVGGFVVLTLEAYRNWLYFRQPPADR